MVARGGRQRLHAVILLGLAGEPVLAMETLTCLNDAVIAQADTPALRERICTVVDGALTRPDKAKKELNDAVAELKKLLKSPLKKKSSPTRAPLVAAQGSKRHGNG